MSTVILLSSSPPRVFARSPTPADSSSPLPSTATLIQGDSPGRRKFKTRSAQREGFQPSFTTARQVLAQKIGAENATITAPSRNRFRSSQGDTADEIKDNQEARSAPGISLPPAKVPTKAKPRRPPADPVKKDCAAVLGVKDVSQAEKRNSRKTTPEPLLLERATARKLDWSPPRGNPSRQGDEKPIEYSAGYMNGMLSEFNYVNELKVTEQLVTNEANNPAKRRRIDPGQSKMTKSMPSISGPSKPDLVPTKVASKRTRSPPKKPLTITALATSNYLGENDSDAGPLMQYLASTQAQLEDVPSNALLEVKVQKTKAAAKKLKGSKQPQTKSLLLSPKSALKTYEDQDTMFGSASQLAREESPTFLRETIEAMKESESFLMSDPFSSPQRTQQISVENTPQAGISRFRKTRNLWAAAGRDEDNALLHVDTVDLTDTPAVRTAFAGKDVLLQPASKPRTSICRPGMSLRGGYSPLEHIRDDSIIDIADIAVPNNVLARTISTTPGTASPRTSPSRIIQERRMNTDSETAAKDFDKPFPVPPPPPKPNYAGLTVHELNKQIKSFGFKAMRKREKMIELLDRCWEEKYGQSKPQEDVEPETVPFGDFLSKVHDLSARPEPKTKKARVKKRKDEIAREISEKPAKKPRQRKKKEPQTPGEDGVAQKPKQPRKRKSKLATDELTLDVDNIWNTIPEELRALEAFDDWAKPEKKVKVRNQKDPMVMPVEEPQRPPTPPATNPVQEPPAPCVIHEEDPVTNHDQAFSKDIISTPVPTPPLASVTSRITFAVMHQSQSAHSRRNHNVNPTWHEKILLYDPIILEDLAAWLNTEGLGAIGEDREVSALDVREWCESRGICCLWRGGWRGNKAAQSQDQ